MTEQTLGRGELILLRPRSHYEVKEQEGALRLVQTSGRENGSENGSRMRR